MLRVKPAEGRTRAIGLCLATGLAPTPENLQAIVDMLAEVWVQAFGEGRLAERKEMTRDVRIEEMRRTYAERHKEVGWGGEPAIDPKKPHDEMDEKEDIIDPRD